MKINGTCAPELAAVQTAFERNFEIEPEIGASVCIYRNGEKLVDLWAGTKDVAGAEAWAEDTVAPIYSTTKGLTAITVAKCVDKGLLDYDAPIATYWPEFAANGKEAITVGQAMSHSAGLPAFKEPVTYQELYGWTKPVEALARQDVWFEPGSRSCYHSTTYGFLAGELVRRVTSKMPSEVFAEEVATPLGLQDQLGLRMTDNLTPLAAEIGDPLAAPPMPADLSAIPPEVISIATNPTFEPAMSNDPVWRSAELPHGAGCGNARSVATLFAAMVGGGALGDVRILSEETVAKATTPRIEGVDGLFGFEMKWGAGFIMAPSALAYGPSPRSFGSTGYGGSYGFADPDTGIAFAYVPNRLNADLTGDPRGRALVTALYDSINGG